MNTPLRIMVGLSGGVDSSVAAAILQQEGHEVIGVFIKVWQADFLPCNWREERRDAMRVAAKLGIPFLTLDLEKEYKEGVVDYLIKEYSEGRVPNPDVMCNKEVKFGSFLTFAKSHGMDAIATGHYARVTRNSDGDYRLREAIDTEKDQSYFLWTLTQHELAHTLFPLGEMKKSEVRTLAEKFGLPTAQKKDSQGICFLGKVDISEFLKHFLSPKKGNVLNDKNEVIGEHDGAILYAIGQRHGFRTHNASPGSAPQYITSKDLEQNTITVSEKTVVSKRSSNSALIHDTSFTSKACELLAYSNETDARIRYRGEKHPVGLDRNTTDGNIRAIFTQEVLDLNPGQSLVLYHKDGTLLGGGIIG